MKSHVAVLWDYYVVLLQIESDLKSDFEEVWSRRSYGDICTQNNKLPFSVNLLIDL